MEYHEKEYRISKSGFSIKTGWGDEKRIIAKCPYSYEIIQKDSSLFNQWLKDAEKIVMALNLLPEPPKD